ncbi:hypothetical protein [Nocardia sp. NPDC024068]|uniref:hypothetical protein n=1 Tax=Nocardia sp. NPDC024068 TaxID=3157197 RepID=UPI0033DDE10A
MEDLWRDSDLQHDLEVGQWVRDSVVTHDQARVESLVPLVFDAYARLLHPVESVAEHGRVRWLRWSDLAVASGASIHPTVQLMGLLERLPAPGRTGVATAAPVPDWPSQLDALARVLAGHTSTSDACWFAFWEGNSAFDGIRVAGTSLEIDGFRYYLAKGPVTAASRTLRGVPAHLWWPVDRAWFVSTHFDFTSAYLGGSRACIDAVLNCADLESLPASGQDPVTSDSDRLN